MVNFPSMWRATENGYRFSGAPYDANLNLKIVGNPTTDDSFTFTGTLSVDGDASNISGSYDGIAKMITFVRNLPGFTQTYTGFLGDGDPSDLSFGGSFTATNYPGQYLRTQFGWFAEQSSVPPPK